MWNYAPFLVVLVPAGLVVVLSPSLLARSQYRRFVALTLVVWLIASLLFAALMVPFESATHLPAIERFLRIFVMVSFVVSIPLAIAAALQFILIRLRVGLAASMAISGLAAAASVFVLPPGALFAACAFVDHSCI